MLYIKPVQEKTFSLHDFRIWLPNALTLGRFALVPFILLGSAFYVFASKPVLMAFGALLAFLAFTCAALFDLFDGYLARRWKTVSTFGSVMDPVADKALMAGGFFALFLAFPPSLIWAFYPAASLMILRDIMVSGLRKYSTATGGSSLPPSRLAKWKTLFEMGALALLLFSFFLKAFSFISSESEHAKTDISDRMLLLSPETWSFSFTVQVMGLSVLWVAAFLSLLSGFFYLRSLVEQKG